MFKSGDWISILWSFNAVCCISFLPSGEVNERKVGMLFRFMHSIVVMSDKMQIEIDRKPTEDKSKDNKHLNTQL